MDFGLNEDQETLAKYARDFLDNECPTTFVRKMLDHDTALDAGFYKHMADLGWMGIAIPEQYGGQGMTYVDLGVLLEEMGRALVPGPFFATVCLAAPVDPRSRQTTRRSRRSSRASRPARGTRPSRTPKPTLASTRPASSCRRAKDGDGFVLNGTKRFVLDAHVADTIIVAARTSESDDPTEGVTLFVARREDAGRVRQAAQGDGHDAPPLRRHARRTSRSARTPSSATSTAAGRGSSGRSSARRACSPPSASAASQKVLDLSVAYARERIQFGRPIGSFQAVKHKCADMLVDVELGRSAMYYAAWAASDEDAGARARRVDRQGVLRRGVHARREQRDPRPRRDRLHLGARHAPVLQAREGERGAARVTRPTTGTKSPGWFRRRDLEAALGDALRRELLIGPRRDDGPLAAAAAKPPCRRRGPGRR